MLNEALTFIDSDREPFFLYFTTTIPHVPLQALVEWVDKYRKKIGDEKPYLGKKVTSPAVSDGHICRHGSYLDFEVGLIVEEFRKKGIYENTIIIFSSDNGPVTGGSSVSVFFGNAKPFTGLQSP